MDADARFRSLYERHQPDVLAFYLRRLGREDAVEATADVFLTAWRRMDDVPGEDKARCWLFGIARNVLRNHQRTNRRLYRLTSRIGSVSADVDPLPETIVLRRAQDREVLEALARLRPRDREVVQLRLWEEASYEEIATLLGCSRHAAEQRYAKALQRLRSVYSRAGHVLRSGTETVPRTQEQRRGT